MTEYDQNQSGNRKAVDFYGFEKILVLLQPLKKSNAGMVLYQQIERSIRDAEGTQDKVTRGYASLALTLIESYRRRLPRDSRLYLELMVVQQRLMPPISVSELAMLQTYLRNVTEILSRVGDVDEDALRQALAPLLDEVRPAERTLTGLETPTVAPHGPDPDKPQSHQASMEQQVTSVYRRRLDRQRQEMEEMQKALANKVNEASRQQEGVTSLLESALQKLKRFGNTDDVDRVRRQLVVDMEELLANQILLATVLRDSRSLLNMVDTNSEQLRNELNQVRVLSLTDDLTQLPNRRAFLRRLENEMERSQRDKSTLTLGMMDLDHFKEINDKYGHNMGDEILRTYTWEILSIFRRYDMVARYGGEEFAVLLPSTDKDGALRAFNKVRKKVGETFCQCAGRRLQLPTFSAGLAVYRAGEPVQTFIDRADRTLYRAKQSGRDCVHVDESYLPEKESSSGFSFDDGL